MRRRSGFSRLWPSLPPLRLPSAALWSRCASPTAATYARTGTAVAFIISELPGERAEALFIAMAA
jgi:hypothetical protein